MDFLWFWLRDAWDSATGAHGRVKHKKTVYYQTVFLSATDSINGQQFEMQNGKNHKESVESAKIY